MQIAVPDAELEVLQIVGGVLQDVQRVEDIKAEVPRFDEGIVQQLFDRRDRARCVKPVQQQAVTDRSTAPSLQTHI